jgi:hypothetical protein
MAAVKVIVVALNEKGEKSKLIRVYQTADGKALPKQFVLKVEDAGISDNGTEQLRLKNGEFGLIVTNSKEYADARLAGFRRHLGDNVFLLCEVYKDDVFTVKSVVKPDNSNPTELSSYLKERTNKVLAAAINDADSVFTASNTLSSEQSLIILQFKGDELIEKHIGKLALHLHNSKVPISINISKNGATFDVDTEISSIIVSLQDVWAKEICDFLGVEFIDPLEKLPSLKGNWLSFGVYKSQLQIPPKSNFGDDINF